MFLVDVTAIASVLVAMVALAMVALVVSLYVIKSIRLYNIA